MNDSLKDVDPPDHAKYRIPEYGLKPGHEELVYPRGMRHVKDLTLAWG
ncbi:hypothetical protein [Candidatus Poriferisocius sp.]